MEIPYSLFSSSQISSWSKDSFCLYLFLRAEIAHGDSPSTKIGKTNAQLVSGIPLDTCAERLGLSRFTIDRLIDEMTKRGWIKRLDNECFLLGEIKDHEGIWFLDEQVKVKSTESDKSDTIESVNSDSTSTRPSDLIMAKIAEDRAKIIKKRINGLTNETKDKLVGTVFNRHTTNEIRPKDLLLHFAALYKKKFDRVCPMIAEGPSDNQYQMTYTYINRALKWSKNPREVWDCIDFIFENWDELKIALALDGLPTYNLLGSSKIWPRITLFRTEGIPKPKYNAKKDASSVTHRFDKSDTNSLGW